MKRIVLVVFGTTLACAGAWFLYRHLRYAGFFDAVFASVSGVMVAAGVLLLWIGRR